ncbi:MAG: transglutaminase family protein [Ancalomicrobiaceae bacterium]|nr:transglutaminase family protein [Ancalomicrobiaceae bacterium]
MARATTYEIRHLTAYEYRMAVPFARCVLRLTPIDRAGQIVRSAELELDPVPEECQDGTDDFGNRITRIAFHRPHTRLNIRSFARVEVVEIDADAVVGAMVARSPNWERIRDLALAGRDIRGLAPVGFLFSSRLVVLADPILTYAARSFEPGRTVVAAAIDLTRRIRRDFVYDPSATNVTTPVQQAFEARRGVCQDFAHVMIAGLRALGIPAAYVSGYLRTVPPPGQRRLEGADAMHAWVSVWCGPEIGWIGLDPTNGIAAGSSHVVLAIGRDYSDVSPVDGVVLTAGEQGLSVAVDVVEMPAAAETGDESMAD